MPTIGETLREARMRQRLDIADVEERTKIRAKYLRALENEEFGMLPGPTFVKTFIRTYSEVLGLDPQVLVEDYRATYESGDEAEQIQSLGPPNLARDKRRQGPRFGPGSLLLLVLVLIVAALVGIGLLTGDEDGEPSSSPTTEAETTPERTEPKEEPKPAPTRVTLRVTPATPTYVCVDRGAGKPVLFEGTIDAARTFKGKTVRLNLGKTDVQLRANGRPVPLETGPDPVGLAFTLEGTQPLPLGERPCA